MASLTAGKAPMGSAWAPPRGSGMISSMIPKLTKSGGVIFSASVACSQDNKNAISPLSKRTNANRRSKTLELDNWETDSPRPRLPILSLVINILEEPCSRVPELLRDQNCLETRPQNPVWTPVSGHHLRLPNLAPHGNRCLRMRKRRVNVSF